MLVIAAFAVTSAAAQFNPQQPIPADKDVRTGKLENGMTYYIRHNEKPKGQADFYILHDVGAIQENDSQQGLAHFLEHMAFNGTKNLPGKMRSNLRRSTPSAASSWRSCAPATARRGVRP